MGHRNAARLKQGLWVELLFFFRHSHIEKKERKKKKKVWRWTSEIRRHTWDPFFFPGAEAVSILLWVFFHLELSRRGLSSFHLPMGRSSLKKSNSILHCLYLASPLYFGFQRRSWSAEAWWLPWSSTRYPHVGRAPCVHLVFSAWSFSHRV